MRIDTQLNWITLDGKTIIRKSAIEEIFYDKTEACWLRLTSGKIHKLSKRDMGDLLDKIGVITEFKK